MVYADSSFLVSLYLESDAKAGVASAYLARQQTPVTLTPLNRVEFRNTLRSMVARRMASSSDVAEAFAVLEDDLNEGLLIEKALDTVDLFKLAERLSSRHAQKTSIRCVDLLHVASAHVLGLETFLTFDRQQAAFARETGLQSPLA